MVGKTASYPTLGLDMPIETIGLEVQDLKAKIIKYENKMTIMRQELMQYIKDLEMWKTAHGADYPMRRREEVLAKLEEIEKI